jgi:chromosome partitioning protein
MLTVTFLNQKGGVGKTSSCHHLAGILALTGRRVLLVDIDPQASLTQGFFGPEATRALLPELTFAAVLDPDLDPNPDALIIPTGFDSISIIRGSGRVNQFNLPPCELWTQSQYSLRELLATIDGEYDVALLDCPPNLNLCAWSALTASDAVVVPLQAEDYGAQGIHAIQLAVRAVQGSVNPRLRLLGYLITMFDRRFSIHIAYETILRQSYGSDVFTNQVPSSIDFKAAVAERKPISHYKPRSAAAKAVQVVAEELLERAAAAGLIAGPALVERGAA